MTTHTAPATGNPIRGVIFDLHATLVHDGGDPAAWLAAAVDLLDSESQGSAATGRREPGPLPTASDLAPWASRIWDYAREMIPAASGISPLRGTARCSTR